MLSWIFSLSLVTFLSSVFLVYLVYFTSPTQEDKLILINVVYFFMTSFVSLAGIISLMLYSFGNFRLKNQKRQNLEQIHKPKILLRRSLAHGAVVSGGLTGIGLLNALDFANGFNIILLLIFVALIEFYFLSH